MTAKDRDRLAADLEKFAARLELAEADAMERAKSAHDRNPNVDRHAYVAGWLGAEARDIAGSLRILIKYDLTSKRARSRSR